MSRFEVHVIPHGDVWAVIREGDTSPVSLHTSKDDAERSGRLLARDSGVPFELHDREGARDIYADDPRDAPD